MTILIATTGWSPDDWYDGMVPLVGGRAMRKWPDVGAPEDIEYALVWHPPEGVLETLPNLKVIFSLGAGVDHILSKPNLPDVPIARVVVPDMTMRMREWVVLHTLIHHRQHLAYAALQTKADWRSIYQPAASEVRVGMLGVGVLGRDCGLGLKQIGFDVAGWSRTPKDGIGFPCLHGATGLDEFLARTDILISLLPHTPETEGMLNRDLFAKLARDGALGGPFVINGGRGKVQVEADILACLEDGTLKGVTLDVFENEPLDAASPLWRHPGVAITPHVAADSMPEAVCATIWEQIQRFEACGELQNLVDQAAGY